MCELFRYYYSRFTHCQKKSLPFPAQDRGTAGWPVPYWSNAPSLHSLQ